MYRSSKAKQFLMILMLCLLVGCDKFQYSPYEVDIDNLTVNLTERNIQRILAKSSGTDSTVRFAVIGDSHDAYDELLAAVKDINGRTDIEFVIHVGDQTELGLLKEYQWSHEILHELNVPFLTAIGNHDCLSNGLAIYERMYGPLDYAFEVNRHKLVFLNTNSLEFSGGVPDLPWLAAQLANADSTRTLVVVSHVPPFGDQFSEDDRQVYTKLLADSGVRLSIHGHLHSYRYSEEPEDGVCYLVTDDIMDRNYCVVGTVGDSVTVNRVYY